MPIKIFGRKIFSSLSFAKKLLIFIILLAVWQFLGMSGYIRTELLPMPTDVLTAFIQMASSGVLLVDSIASVKRVLIGFVIASFLGIVAGMLLASFNRAANYLTPLIELLRPIPPIAWIPIAILWFGIGDNPAFFLVALGAFFPVFSNTYEGVKNIQKTHIHAAKSLRANKMMMLFDVLLPAALPSILIGLHIGLGFAWMVVITAEMVGAASGLGYMIQLNRIMLQTQFVIVGMIVIGLIGFLMLKGMKIFETFIIPWKRMQIAQTMQEVQR